MTEWKDLPTMQDVARAQADGWEIEVSNGTSSWHAWKGISWHSDLKFRARPRQPKMKKVKSLCWRHAELGNLSWWVETFTPTQVWQRVQSEDRELEVPDGN